MKMESRIVLDCVMLLALLALMVKPLTGVIVHEALGVGFIVMIVVHCVNNKIWVNNARKSTRPKDGAGMKLVLLAVNVLLFASFALAAVSGVMVSVVVFGFLEIPFSERFYEAHALSARAMLVLSLVHLMMHKKMIAAHLRKKKRSQEQAAASP